MTNGWHIDGEVCRLKNCPQPHWSTREQAMVGKDKLDELESNARRIRDEQAAVAEFSLQPLAEAPRLDASENAATKVQALAQQLLNLGPVIIITRPDDRTLNISVEYGGEAGEDITTATHDEHGWDGIDLVKDTVVSLGEALGVRVEER